ncbi:hypothetical protein GGR57DRAFT_501185 [Xylariaceae sp. FL1272]|nr:hypothetical protein GGR57DRAFT_501185 [Xylariaceae sp. FL1272]
MAPLHGIELIDSLPKRGFIYDSKLRITDRLKRDRAIRRTLKAVPLDLKNREAVDKTLASVFVEGRHEDIIKIARLSWAKDLSDFTFYDFILKMVDARKAYNANPRPPFDVSQHSETARAIDELIALAGSNWNTMNTDLALFQLAGGLDEGDEEDEDAERMDLESLDQSLDAAVTEDREKNKTGMEIETEMEMEVDPMEVDE